MAIRKEIKIHFVIEAILSLIYKKGKKASRLGWTADICRLSSDKMCLKNLRIFRF